jgi:hypothetical protein
MVKLLLIWLIISIISSLIASKFISVGKGGDVYMAKAKEAKKGGTKKGSVKSGSGKNSGKKSGC